MKAGVGQGGVRGRQAERCVGVLSNSGKSLLA